MKDIKHVYSNNLATTEYIPIIKDSTHPMLSGVRTKRYDTSISMLDILGALIGVLILLSAYFVSV